MDPENGFDVFKRHAFYTRERLLAAVQEILSQSRELRLMPSAAYSLPALQTEKLKQDAGLTDEEFLHCAVGALDHSFLEDRGLNSSFIRSMAASVGLTESELLSRMSQAAKEAMNMQRLEGYKFALQYGKFLDAAAYVRHPVTGSAIDNSDPDIHATLIEGINGRYLNKSPDELTREEREILFGLFGAAFIKKIIDNAERINQIDTPDPHLYAELERAGYAPESIEQIVNFFAEIDPDEYEHADNFRYARIKNGEEMAEYERREHAGCCGSEAQEIVTEKDGPVIVGFNYGH